MTWPLVALGVLTVVGGWLNLPAIVPLGPLQVLHHWLEPVVGGATLAITGGQEAHVSHSTEYVLVGVAVLIAVAGIAFAYARLKPQALVPKNEAPEEEGFERVLVNKYYVDEAYDKAIVQPVVGLSRSVLWRGMDVGLIDGLLVNGSAWAARAFGWLGSRLQTGSVGTYAWVLLIGVLAVLSAFSFR
jgi:NADH-quinone oxidoreductase subunit L